MTDRCLCCGRAVEATEHNSIDEIGFVRLCFQCEIKAYRRARVDGSNVRAAARILASERAGKLEGAA